PRPDLVMLNDQGLEQGHVVLAQSTLSGSRAFEFWMVKENGVWRVMNLWIGQTQIFSLSGSDVWEQAKRQRAEGHSFNALVLYNMAHSFIWRGPYVRLADSASFDQDFSSFRPPEELSTNFPLEWRLGGRAFLTNGIGPMWTRGDRKISLVINWTPSSWS